MTFHRFPEQKRVRIFIDQQVEGRVGQGVSSEVTAINPFGYETSGHPEYPKKFEAQIEEVGPLELIAHIWPPLSKSTEYMPGRRASSRQGFYIYRNDRLIQAGGWNGLLADESEPHNSLARIAIDLPPDYDSVFGLNVQKSNVIVPPNFESVFRSKTKCGLHSFEEYRKQADETYRSGAVNSREVVGSFASAGLDSNIRKLFRDAFAASDVEEGFEVIYGDVPNGKFIHLDLDEARLTIDPELLRIPQEELLKVLLVLLFRKGFKGKANKKI